MIQELPFTGQSHSFDVGMATQFGLHPAVIFNHILFWITHNHRKGINIIDGKAWVYETQQQMADYFGYISLDEVKKAMVKLLDSGLLIKGNFNKNPFDKTGWYTINETLYNKIIPTKVPIGTIDNSNKFYDSANRHDRECQSAPSLYRDIITSTDIKQQQQQCAHAQPPESENPFESAAVFFQQQTKKQPAKKEENLAKTEQNAPPPGKLNENTSNQKSNQQSSQNTSQLIPPPKTQSFADPKQFPSQKPNSPETQHSAGEIAKQIQTSIISPLKACESIKTETHIPTYQSAQKEAKTVSNALIYDCLKSIEIPEKDKQNMTKKYDEESVKHAVSWATNPESSAKNFEKGLTAALYWACKEKPEIPISKQDLFDENKQNAIKFDGLESKNGLKIECYNKEVLFYNPQCSSVPKSLLYSMNGFKQKFLSFINEHFSKNELKHNDAYFRRYA